ncbi:MAG TPA: metallophosphoesterase family protein [Planctomycetota bacterium]|nr:metallophosphoesterase family protein [Planctomycetota bacterium]
MTNAAALPRAPVRAAFFGGIYSNHIALAAAIESARSLGVDAMFCLGDLGAFGPHPDLVFPLLEENGVVCISGNYDDSLARGLTDCQCGYSDPRDNHFARLSYRYTFEKTSARNKAWLGELPRALRLEMAGRRVLLCHGSPRRMNEFLWESTTPDHFLEKLCRDHDSDVIIGTHTGLPWSRELEGGRLFVNAGVLGRPANDGTTDVSYAVLETDPGGEKGWLRASFVPVAYDHAGLAREMSSEGLPEEFIETIETGWWTTCLEVLPARERLRGKW